MMKRYRNGKLWWPAIALAIVAWSALYTGAAPITLVHMTHAWHGAGWHAFVEETAAEFMAANPDIKVDVLIAGAGGDYLDKSRVMTVAGTPPDVTDFSSGNGFISMEGMFTDLGPYLAKEPAAIRDNILQNALELYTTEGVLWGMPNSLFMVVSWFNNDLLDKVGLTPPNELQPDEWNWATLRSYAQKLTLDPDGDGTVDQWGLDRQSAAWIQFVASNGGYLYEKRDDPAQSRWASEQVVQAIDFNRQLIQDDRVASVGWDASMHFWTGRTAMAVVDGPGRLASLKDVDFNWNIAVQPAGPNGCHCGTVSADGFQINAYSENKDAAWEYVKFLTTRADSVNNFVAHTGRFPALLGVHEAYPLINETAPANWQAFVQAAAAPGAYFAPTVPEGDLIDGIANPLLAQVWDGRLAAQVAMEQIHAQVQALLDARHK